MSLSALILIALASYPQQDAGANNPQILLEGKVVNGDTGEPVAKARVSLEDAAGRTKPALLAATSSAGRFAFAQVDPVGYRLTVQKRGFLDGAYGKENPDDDSLILNLSTANPPADLTLRLFPAGAISGRILDEDGDALPKARVVLTRPAPFKGTLDDTVAGENGEFKFVGLTAGAYFVSATGDPDGTFADAVPVDQSGKPTKVREITTYYPDAVVPAGARKILVERGHERSGIDIRIRRAPFLAVTGKATGIEPSIQYSVSASFHDGGLSMSAMGKILPNGDFTISGIPPGHATLNLFERASERLLGRTDVDLLDQDLTGIQIAAFKPSQLRIRLSLDGEDEPLTRGSVFLGHTGDERGLAYSQWEQHDGVYAFPNVSPGRYLPMFNGAPGTFLKSIFVAGHAADSPDYLEVPEGADLDVQLVFSRKVATIVGDVVVAHDSPKRPFSVLVVDEIAPEPLKLRTADLDQFWHFSLTGLPPGHYSVFAAEETDPDLWINHDFLELMRTPDSEVKIGEGERTSLSLKITPKETSDHARKQLGL